MEDPPPKGEKTKRVRKRKKGSKEDEP
jgi:hypothetical protein